MAKAKQGALHPVHAPSDEKALLVKEYSEVLIRKLEEKALQLEDANRALQQDIAERKLRERELDAISIVSTALRTATSRAEMMPIILDQLLALLPADGASKRRAAPLPPVCERILTPKRAYPPRSLPAVNLSQPPILEQNPQLVCRTSSGPCAPLHAYL
jgi:hypothetical protein